MISKARVKVKFFGFFIDLAGKKEFNTKVEGTITLGELFNLIDERCNENFKKNVIDPETQRLRAHVILVLNGTDITRRRGLDIPIKGGDELAFYPISAGG